MQALHYMQPLKYPVVTHCGILVAVLVAVHNKIGKRAWSYLQNFLCVLCQQSSYGLEELLYSMLTQQLNTGCERNERRVVH